MAEVATYFRDIYHAVSLLKNVTGYVKKLSGTDAVLLQFSSRKGEVFIPILSTAYLLTIKYSKEQYNIGYTHIK